jgi:hypothetical protein
MTVTYVPVPVGAFICQVNDVTITIQGEEQRDGTVPALPAAGGGSRGSKAETASFSALLPLFRDSFTNRRTNSDVSLIMIG